MNTLIYRLRQITLSQVVAIFSIIFVTAPFIVVMGASFDAGNAYQLHFPPRTLSLASYIAIPESYWRSLGTSALIGALVAILSAFLGLLAALGIVRGRIASKETLQAFFRVPVQIPLVVTGAVFLQFYYQIASILHVNLATGLAGIVVAHLFVATPYSIGAISAVLVRMDLALEEAAQSLGATNLHTFTHVMFPMLRPGIMAGLFYGFIMSFGDVPIAIFLVNKNVMTLPVRIFQDMQFDFRPSMLAMSTIVVLLSLVAIIGTQKLAGFDLVMPSGNR